MKAVKVLFILLAIVILSVTIVACRPEPTPTPTPPIPTTEEPTITPTPFEPLPEHHVCLDGLSFAGPATVIDVQDVDTLRIETPSGKQTIDLVGVNGWSDAAREASGKAFMEELVEGKEIEVAQDPVVQVHNGKQAFYVYVDGIFVNLEVLGEGHARPRAEVVDQLVCADAFIEASK